MAFKITNKGPRAIAVLVPGGPVIVKSGKSESFDHVPTNLDALVKVGAISQDAADKGREDAAKAEEERRAAAAEAKEAADIVANAALRPAFAATAAAAAGTPAGGDKAAPAAPAPAAPAKAASAAPKGGTA